MSFRTHIFRTSLILKLHLSNLNHFGFTFVELDVCWTYTCQTSCVSDHIGNLSLILVISLRLDAALLITSVAFGLGLSLTVFGTYHPRNDNVEADIDVEAASDCPGHHEYNRGALHPKLPQSGGLRFPDPLHLGG